MPSDRSRELYETLVSAHATDLFRFAFRLTGSTSAAEDLVQETFQEAWRGLSRLRCPESGRAWLFQILRNRQAHRVRAAGRRPRITTDVDALPERAVDPSSRSSLQDALDELDERYTVPFLMVFVEGLTCRETAEALGLPIGTGLSRIHRARAALRRTLELEGDPRVVTLEGARTKGRRA
jgi:RNA polymerase sigma-70 factor (ECF subfamily)